ncbi:MAG: hypothetical protein DCC44_06450 [Acidobacteria bacterium]|nr:MAG: hypothetical protein DCC44_06450 [Acidobacteriota bacterium]
MTFVAAGDGIAIDGVVGIDGPVLGGALPTMIGAGVEATRGTGVGTGLKVEVTTTFDVLELLSSLFDWAKPAAANVRTSIEENANSFFIIRSRSG